MRSQGTANRLNRSGDAASPREGQDRGVGLSDKEHWEAQGNMSERCKYATRYMYGQIEQFDEADGRARISQSVISISKCRILTSAC